MGYVLRRKNAFGMYIIRILTFIGLTYDCVCLLPVVRDVLAIGGGKLPDNKHSTTWSIIMSGGVECTDHGLPDIPVELDGFGLAQAHDRFIYLCGGRDATTGMYWLKLTVSLKVLLR